MKWITCHFKIEFQTSFKSWHVTLVAINNIHSTDYIKCNYNCLYVNDMLVIRVNETDIHTYRRLFIVLYYVISNFHLHTSYVHLIYGILINVIRLITHWNFQKDYVKYEREDREWMGKNTKSLRNCNEKRICHLF